MDTLDDIESLPWFREEVRRLQRRIVELEKQAGDDANRQDLLRLLIANARKHDFYLGSTFVSVTRAQFNAMCEAIGEKGLE